MSFDDSIVFDERRSIRIINLDGSDFRFNLSKDDKISSLSLLS